VHLKDQNVTANALDIQGVGRRFGGFWAVNDVSLIVRPGERRAILGPNGAGKTTLFNVLTGDLAASSGTVFSFGEDITDTPITKRIAGGMRRTYQHAHLFNGLSVRENLFLAVCGVAGGWAQFRPLKASDERLEKAEFLAETAGISGSLNRSTSDLSHGERRQLEIGMALAESPRLMLLDEPAAGLSPAERPKLRALLEGLPSDITVVLIEHDMDIALKVCDTVTVLYNGETLAEGSPEKIMKNEAVHKVYMGGTHGD
jgi:branched-chain amino acid transport system ATP-binding protein